MYSKYFKSLLFLVFIFVLGGCNIDKPEEIVIENSISLKVDEVIEVTLPNEFFGLDLSKNVWTNNNEEIVFLENGTVLGISAGQALIKVTNGNYVFKLTVSVYDVKEYEKQLYEITSYIRNKMSLVGDKFFEIVEEIEGYSFEIWYTSQNPEILDLNGYYVRGLIDQSAYIKATIKLMGITSEFTILVKIEMIPAEEQRQVVNEFLDEQVKDIINSESGQLPKYFTEYDLALTWRANQPGVVGADYKLYTAYNQASVNLYASYLIGGKTESMEFKYNSKGTQNKEEYIDRVLNELIPEQSTMYLNTIYGVQEEVIQDFIYPDSVTQLRPGTGKVGKKMPGGPQYVVIHDTGMTNIGDNADGLNEYIHSQANSPDGRVASWHFSIDDTKTYQHVPTDEVAWHAGDGSAAFGTTYFNTSYNAWSIGGGNLNGIGIETCINPGNDYELTLKRTAKLTASLLLQYNLGLDRIKQHNDFSGKNCPAVIRGTKGLWETFLKDVETEYFLMMIAKDVDAKWDISHPEIIKSSGKVVKPINDTTVTLKLTITLDGTKKVYNYTTFVKGMTFSEKLSRVNSDILTKYVSNRANSNITLPTYLEAYKATITWESSHPNIISNTGSYTKPDKETVVKLTATIKIGNDVEKREYNVKVS